MLNRIKKWKNKNDQLNENTFPKYLRKSQDLNLSMKFKKGDKEAFARIYRKLRKPILNYLFCKLRNHDVAEELAQEVFLKAFRFRESFDPQFEFSTWLWTIARNTLSDWYRKNRQNAGFEDGSAPVQLDLEDVPSMNPNPEVAFLETADQKALLQMLSALTDLQKKALFMRLIHRLSYDEIAKRLNLSLSAVKSVLHRARGTLMSRLPQKAALSLVP